MHKIKTIIRKEWADVFQDRSVLFATLLMPLLFGALPLVFLITMRGVDSSGIPPELMASLGSGCPKGVSPIECLQLAVLNQFTMMFMLTPLIIPVNIAAYSVIGEKTNRSLEPLLATPITTAQLLIAKNLAAAIPAIVATWISFLLYTAGATLLVGNPRIAALILQSVAWIAALVLGPLLALLSVNICLIISSRVNQPHAAEQLSSMVILPLLLLFVGQMAGIVVLDRRLVFLLAAVLLVVDALLLRLAVGLFRRETILTRWK